MRIQYKCLFPIYAFPEMKLLEMEIRTEAAQFPEKEYINGIFLAVWKG
jgi:hypothetical protein